jgi:transposase
VGAAVRRAVLHRDREPRHHCTRLDAKKKTLSACERDEVARAAWRKGAAEVDPAACVWVDEFGSHLGLTRTYARAPRGERAIGSAPRNRGANRTTITSLTLAGLGPGLVLERGVTTRGFEAYVEHLLAPTLRPGQVVILDNLRQHHSQRTRELIEARGAELRFLPAYSPDLNPIEEAFSKVKTHLRRAAARTHEDLVAAIWMALASITSADAWGYATHAGYRLPLAQAA